MSSAPKKGMSGDTKKLLLAVGIFVIAGVVYLIASGKIPLGGGSSQQEQYTPPTQEQQQEMAKQQKARDDAVKSGRATIGGS